MHPSRDFSTLAVRPLTPHIGAEVDGIDLSKPLSNEQFSEVSQALLDWKVLVFRDQHLDRDAHKAFGRRFGRLHVHPIQANAKPGAHRYGEDPEVLVVRTDAKSRYTAGNGWHADVTCDAAPPMGSMLYITEVPEHGGGDTLFANMYRACEKLSPTLRGFLEGLTAVHDGAIPYMGNYGIAPAEGRTYPRNEHPVIIRHPQTGRQVLYVNPGFTSHIVGLERWESRALLDALYRQVAEDVSLHCRVRWEPNTLTFWDNRCTQHHAAWDYFPESRYGERVTIVDDVRPAA